MKYQTIPAKVFIGVTLDHVEVCNKDNADECMQLYFSDCLSDAFDVFEYKENIKLSMNDMDAIHEYANNLLHSLFCTLLTKGCKEVTLGNIILRGPDELFNSVSIEYKADTVYFR